MGEHTPCNRCSLRGIERRAAERGATVSVARQPALAEMGGWYKVSVSDRPDPVAWFMELTVECCC